MVFIPETSRGTLCISTQAGCAVNCRFCSTGKQGFNRNLTAGEIIGQLWLANRMLGTVSPGKDESGERIVSNVVLMGMGEPLLNYQPVLTSLRLMLDDTRVRPVAPPGHAVHVRRGADDGSPARRLSGRARGVAARVQRCVA